jgi:ATP-dependent RNA helicase DDX5/DBP2
MKKGKVLIFTATKRTADSISYSMRDSGWPARAIHGDKNQTQRDNILREFKTGSSPLMVATDVASRGLDIKDVNTVINYDMANGIEDYVHRIGRTARAGRKGDAFTLFTPDDANKARDLIKILEDAKQDVPRELRDIAATARGSSRGRYSRGRSRGGSRGGYGGNRGYGRRY